MLIYGVHPVSEALAASRVSMVWVAGRSDRRVNAILDRAASSGIPVKRVERVELDRMVGGVHQGVVARVESLETFGPRELVERARGVPLIVVLDGVQDPQNFGAVVRTAEGAGVDGVVYATRRAAPPGGGAIRASAGALAHARLAPVVNISRAIGELKSAGVWVVGLDDAAERPYVDIDYTVPTAVVVGAEGTGLRRLVSERCDWLVSIPMLGSVSSLNVSVAAGVVLFEAVRQRRLPVPEGRGGRDLEEGTKKRGRNVAKNCRI